MLFYFIDSIYWYRKMLGPVQTSDIETKEPSEIHSETCREEPQHIDGMSKLSEVLPILQGCLVDLGAPDDRTRTSLANQGGTLDQNSPTSDSWDTEGAGGVTNAASEVHMSFEEALWQTFAPYVFRATLTQWPPHNVCFRSWTYFIVLKTWY